MPITNVPTKAKMIGQAGLPVVAGSLKVDR